MLSEIEARGLDETAYESAYRDHHPQANIVAGYLAKLRDIGDSHCELAFATILTDYVASAMHAGEPCLEHRRCYARNPIATKPAGPEEMLAEYCIVWVWAKDLVRKSLVARVDAPTRQLVTTSTGSGHFS